MGVKDLFFSVCKADDKANKSRLALFSSQVTSHVVSFAAVHLGCQATGFKTPYDLSNTVVLLAQS